MNAQKAAYGLTIVLILLTAGCNKSASDAAPAAPSASNSNAVSLPAPAAPHDARATEQLKVLSEAMKAEHITEIRRLVQAGADVNIVNKNGLTPLMVACGLGYTDIARLLLEAEADVTIKARFFGKDYTPLSVAQQWNHPDIVTLLKDYGAKE
ncbi:ankyrin repeat domain-containing protein [Anaerohalosphaeraceae bacterium U12dextr]|jgi:ankyrin repeat protein